MIRASTTVVNGASSIELKNTRRLSKTKRLTHSTVIDVPHSGSASKQQASRTFVKDQFSDLKDSRQRAIAKRQGQLSKSAKDSCQAPRTIVPPMKVIAFSRQKTKAMGGPRERCADTGINAGIDRAEGLCSILMALFGFPLCIHPSYSSSSSSSFFSASFSFSSSPSSSFYSSSSYSSSFSFSFLSPPVY